ncbi:flagellar biosynthesis protein FlhA [Gammaproteobacteria bacterium]
MTTQTQVLSVLRATFRNLLANGLGAPLLLMGMLSMMVLPMAPFMLDIFFTFNLALSLIVLMATVYIQRPMEFAAFPTVLLVTTLLRLSLNIASTRVVLLEGHAGPGAAGQVIQAFGDFVVGGNFAVGLVVFAILIIINFAVVTKGAGRISEVSARFTLDAMPGKQMAIDADLNAGIINQDEARTRRSEVMQESDFYGSMDGASKFVRGDAVAGILILFINVLGGLTVGVLQHGLGAAEAARIYTLLTVGDGLVAQIPSLMLSTAAAIMVTRVSAAQDMGQAVTSQLFRDPRALGMTAGIIGIMGMIPGMPNVAFLSLALLAGVGTWWLVYRRDAVTEAERTTAGAAAPSSAAQQQQQPQEQKELSWDDVVQVDLIGLEVGYRLIPLVDKNQGGQLMKRIKGVRKKLSQDLGFLVPAVHIRDNLDLPPGTYRITLLGVTEGEAEIYPERDMAINPGKVYGHLPGIETKDPAFGLDAVWIEASQRDQAQVMGYTLVDASTVVATHLSQILQDHSHELLGREEVQQILDKLKGSFPKLVEDLVATLPLGITQKILQNLLEERISLRDMRTIAETLASSGARDPASLTAAVRVALGRSIVQNITGVTKELPVITLDPALEQLLHQIMQSAGEAGPVLEPGLAERIHKALAESTNRQEVLGQPSILLVSAILRPWFSRFVRNSIPTLHVLSYHEVPEDRQIRIVSAVGRG